MMGKTVVIYKSYTGYTKKYAEWLADVLKCDLMENQKMTVSKLNSYDTVILGGSVMAGMIAGADFIKKNLEQLKEKKLVVYACGMDSLDQEGAKKMWSQNFNSEQLPYVKCFYCRGGLDFGKLKGMKKFMLKMMCKKFKSKPVKSQSEQDMVKALEAPLDFTEKGYIQPIITYVNTQV